MFCSKFTLQLAHAGSNQNFIVDVQRPCRRPFIPSFALGLSLAACSRRHIWLRTSPSLQKQPSRRVGSRLRHGRTSNPTNGIGGGVSAASNASLFRSGSIHTGTVSSTESSIGIESYNCSWIDTPLRTDWAPRNAAIDRLGSSLGSKRFVQHSSLRQNFGEDAAGRAAARRAAIDQENARLHQYYTTTTKGAFSLASSDSKLIPVMSVFLFTALVVSLYLLVVLYV